VVMTVARRPDELWIGGRVTKGNVRRPLIARLGRKAQELACAGLNHSFDHRATARRKRDGFDPGTDGRSPDDQVRQVPGTLGPIQGDISRVTVPTVHSDLI